MLHKNHFSFRDGISALLMDTCEENPLHVSIILDTDDDMGLSSNDKLRITKLYQHPSEGIIYLKFDGDDNYCELEDYSEFIPQIYNYLMYGGN